MKNTNKNRRGKVAAIFLALLVTATAVPAMSISALAAETNNNTTVQPQDGGVDTYNTTTSGRAVSTASMPDTITGLTYAYDVQRSPGYPVFGGSNTTVKVSDLQFANVPNSTVNDYSLSCTLTNVGKYKDLETRIGGSSIVGTFKSRYNLQSTDDFTIYELKGTVNKVPDTHIAYGIIYSYDSINNVVGFVGWTSESGASYGYLLSQNSLSTTQNLAINVDPLNDQYTTTTTTTPGEPASQHTHCVCNGTASGIGGHRCNTTTTWTAVTNELPKTGGNYYLTQPIEISSTWTPANGTSLCLNGQTITYTGTGTAIEVSNGGFSLTDDKGTGKITNPNGRGVIVKNDTSMFNMYNGRITGCNASSDGSAVKVSSGTFNLFGGSIDHNTVASYGTVFVGIDAVVYMYGGKITENTLTETSSFGGGGVYVRGSFTMNDGEITNNDASGARGGGVYCTSFGTVIINGGTISGNKARANGGDGIYYSYESNDTVAFKIGGSANIVDEILLAYNSSNGRYATIISALQNPITFNIQGASDGRIIAKGDEDNNYTLTPADMQKITMKDAKDATNQLYAKLDTNDNAIKLTSTKPEGTVTVTYNANFGSSPATTTRSGATSVTAEDCMFTRAGYIFAGWNTEPNGTGINYAAGATIDADTTLYAQWTNPAAPITPNTLTYNGNEQPLVTKKTDETQDVKYIVGGTEPAADSIAWSSAIPKEINAGTYTVWYKATESGITTIDSVTATINQATNMWTSEPGKKDSDDLRYTGNPIELVETGSAHPSTKFGDIEYQVVKYNGETVAAASDNAWKTQIPTATEAGKYKVYYRVKETTNYTGLEGNWDVSIAKKTPDLTIDSAPLAEDWTYNGTSKDLCKKIGIDSNIGTVSYAVTKGQDSTEDNITDWSTEVPKATNAGTYKVWYKVDIKEEHAATYDNIGATPLQVNTGRATVVVSKADPEISVTANDLTYTGKDQVLVKVTTSGGAWRYSLDNDIYAVAVPTAKNAGKYTVYYISRATMNYNDSGLQTIEAEIKQATPTVTVEKNDNLTYNGKDQQLVTTSGVPEGCTVQYKVNDGDWSTAIPTAKNAGSYKVSYKVTGNTNYADVAETEVGTVTIAKAKVTVTLPTFVTAPLTYTGNAQDLVTGGTLASDDISLTVPGTVRYYISSVKLDNDRYTPTTPTGDITNWKTICKGTDAKKYYIWWAIDGADTTNFDYQNVDGTEVQTGAKIQLKNGDSEFVTINKADIDNITPPTLAEGWTYDGTSHPLIKEEGSTNDGKMMYAVTRVNEIEPTDERKWSADIPQGINAGKYRVWYKVDGDENHNSSKSVPIGTVTIKQATVTVTPPKATNPTYNGNKQIIATEGSLDCDVEGYGKLFYGVTDTDYDEFPEGGYASLSADETMKTAAGTYRVWYEIAPESGSTDFLLNSNFKYVLETEDSEVGTEITEESNSKNYIEASIKAQPYTPVTTHSITFNTNGGSPVQTQWVTSGGKLSNLPTTTKEGCTFAGWYTDEALTQPFSADTAITKNTVLYAKWTEKADPTDPGEGVTVGQVTGLKAIKKTTTTLKLTFNKVEGASGYEIYDAETNELLTTCTTQKGKAKLVKTITGLNAGEVRKYKVRAYVIVNGEKHYGAFSKVYTKATAERTPVLLATVTKTTGTSVKLRWTPVDGAVKYQVYGAICSETPVRLKTVSGETTDWTSKSLKRATSYKYYVVALDEVGKKIATAPIIHVVTNGSKYGNPEQLILTSDAAITMTKGGKVANVLTELTASPAEKEPLTHIAALRYRSDDKTVAKVDKDGVITAVNKGTCTVYVIAQNGLYQAVTVTVE